MYTTIRSRMWLGYTLLIVILLGGLLLGLTVNLARNPVLYRQADQKLQSAARQVNLLQIDPADIAKSSDNITTISQQSGVRILVVNRAGNPIFDALAKSTASITRVPILSVLRTIEFDQVAFIRDTNNTSWIYNAQPLSNGDYLLFLMKQSRLPLLTVMRQAVARPVYLTLLAGLLFSLILTYLYSRWIVEPIQKIESAAHQISAEKAQQIPEEGPAEIKSLARSFNEMSRRVAQSQASQRDFVSDVSHELKTPLTSIQGFSQAILDGTAQTPTEIQHAAEIIHTESDRMNALVMNLLTLTRLEGGAEKLNRTQVPVEPLVKAVFERLEIKAQKAGVNLESNVNSLPDVYGDPDQLLRVMINLVENAIMFSPQGSKIRVNGELKDDWMLLKVSDQGVGIALADQERIFDRFYKVDKSRSQSENQSTGLGLSIARQIALAHGGNLTLESQPGSGSTFTLRLPVRAPGAKG